MEGLLCKELFDRKILKWNTNYMSKKALIFGGAGIMLIGLVVFLFSFFNSSKNLQSETLEVDRNIFPTINEEDPQSLKTFYDFSFFLPENWRLEEANFLGGESIVIRPVSNSRNDYFPSFIIMRYSPNEFPKLVSKVSSLKSHGMKSYSVKAGGFKLSGVQGVNPITTNIGGEEKNYYDKILLFKNNNASYYIEYKYLWNEKNPKYESVFDAILSSLKVY